MRIFHETYVQASCETVDFGIRMINNLMAVNKEQKEAFDTLRGIGGGVIVGTAVSVCPKVPKNLVAVCDECQVGCNMRVVSIRTDVRIRGISSSLDLVV